MENIKHMGKITVSIPHVTWRDGRPRFIPGPRLRKLGFKGEDLRHPDGSWFSFEQASAWADNRARLIEQMAAKNPRQRRAAHRSGAITLGQLFDLFLADPRLNGQALVEGRKTRPPLSANTVRGYRYGARVIENLQDGRLWHAPAAAITAKTLDGALDRIEVSSGLSTARATRASISAAYSWGMRKGKLDANPAIASTTTLPTPAPRIRYGSIEEMAHLVKAADLLGRPEIGDAIMLGLWTGQRQNDRLALAGGQITENGILFRQSKKNGQPLLIPAAPELASRLKNAQARRADWQVNYHNVILDEAARRPFAVDHYRKQFRKVRDLAVKGLCDENGIAVLAPMASLADFHDQDLRDTAVTWLAWAGASKFEIASITGHTLGSIDTILKHYLGMHPELARSAIGKLVTWYEGEKGT